MNIVYFHKNNLSKIVLALIGLIVFAMGIVLFCCPPELSSDLSQAFQVLRSMHLGAGFNNLVSPDQGDISQSFSQFFTWWSPGQYLVPYWIQLSTGLNMGHSIALTIMLSELCGLAGFYCFFIKLGFSKNIAAISLLMIVCQIAFVIPYVYYNGGEVLLFAFEGWFLYGCASIKTPGLRLVLLVLLSAFIGFFLKSSFLWMYAAGLLCLWIRLAACNGNKLYRLKLLLWVGLPAAVALAAIYTGFIAKGESPASVSYGFKLTWETFAYPIASPLLAGFSVDELLRGLEVPIVSSLLSPQWNFVILLLAALLSVLLIVAIARYLHNSTYRLFLVTFYAAAIVFFGYSYWHQLDISMEARHFRIVGLLLAPGVISLAARLKPGFKMLLAIAVVGIGFYSFSFLIQGVMTNASNARGILGVAQPNIDQVSLNKLIKLDKENNNLTFVLIGDDIGLELLHNRIIPLQPIPDDFRIDTGDYIYQGHGGPLYIVMPGDYQGVKEKMILKFFRGYQNFNSETLSPNYRLYVAK